MECLPPCEISWCWTPGAPAFAADSTKYWWLGLLMAKKTCEELCTLHSSIWSAWDGKEYDWYTNRTRGWVCRIKICDLPQTRRAVFLLHTSARNTKTPCWDFHCWYSMLGSLHRKSSKKRLRCRHHLYQKNNEKWTQMNIKFGDKTSFAREKKTVFEDRALRFFFFK